MSINRYCDRCGTPTATGTRFCAGCGAPVGSSEIPTQTTSSSSNKGLVLAVVGGAVAGLIVVALLGFVLWPRLSGGDKVASIATPAGTSGQGANALHTSAVSPTAAPAKAVAPTASPDTTSAPTPTVASSASPTAAPATPTPAPTASQPTATQPAVVASPGGDADRGSAPDLAVPESYLPRPGTQLELHEIFPSGEEADVELIAAKIADPVQVTVLRVLLEDGEVLAQFTEHFVKRQDGIYAIPDDDPSMPYLWLANNLKKGARWEKDGVVSTVVDTGVRADLGFTVVENCLVVEYDNTAVGYKETICYAPGLGAVLSKSPGGDVMMQLKGVKSLGEEQAADILRPLAPNVGNVKP